jgi:hypothetical protein
MALEIERRYDVTGVKHGKEFKEGSRCYGNVQREVDLYQKRIDNPPEEAWQPTILEAVFYEREVGPWREIARTEPADRFGPEVVEPFSQVWMDQQADAVAETNREADMFRKGVEAALKAIHEGAEV